VKRREAAHFMTPDELQDFLAERQVNFEREEIQNGFLFRCESGEKFAAYTTGRVVCQGKPTELSKAVKEWKKPAKAAHVIEPSKQAALGPDKRVFIVYGHDIVARDALELVLRRMGLEPIVLENLPAAGDTVIEKLEHYLKEHGNVGFACVLLTPDDEGHQSGKPEEKKYRARQNVILELGMVLARLGRQRVAILTKESVEHPSDIAGLIYRPFKERVEEVKAKLYKDLEAAGYKPDTAGL
jgi:predicted nucleotide-binding protein